MWHFIEPLPRVSRIIWMAPYMFKSSMLPCRSCWNVLNFDETRTHASARHLKGNDDVSVRRCNDISLLHLSLSPVQSFKLWLLSTARKILVMILQSWSSLPSLRYNKYLFVACDVVMLKKTCFKSADTKRVQLYYEQNIANVMRYFLSKDKMVKTDSKMYTWI